MPVSPSGCRCGVGRGPACGSMPAAEEPAAEVFAGRTSTLRPEPAAEGDATDAALGCPSDQGAADSADQVPVPADGTADAGDAIVTPSDDGP